MGGLWISTDTLAKFDSLRVLDLIWQGRDVPPEELRKLTAADRQRLWYTVGRSADVSAPQARGASAEDIARVVYPYRRWLIERGLASADQRRAHSAYVAEIAADPLPRPWSEELSDDEQLRCWEYVDPDAAGSDKYPFRRELIAKGRPHPHDQARYATEMREKSLQATRARLLNGSAVEATPPAENGTRPTPIRSADDGVVPTIPGRGQRGRRRGTGTFANRREFRVVVLTAAQALNGSGRRITEQNVAEFFTNSRDPSHPKCNDRQLRKWLEAFDYKSWDDLLADITPELESQFCPKNVLLGSA